VLKRQGAGIARPKSHSKRRPRKDRNILSPNMTGQMRLPYTGRAQLPLHAGLQANACLTTVLQVRIRDVYSHNLNTGERRAIAEHPGLTPAPLVAGRKTRGALLSKSGSPEVYVCDADGGNLRQTPDPVKTKLLLAGTPDAGRLVSVRGQAARRPSIRFLRPRPMKRLRFRASGSSRAGLVARRQMDRIHSVRSLRKIDCT